MKKKLIKRILSSVIIFSMVIGLMPVFDIEKAWAQTVNDYPESAHPYANNTDQTWEYIDPDERTVKLHVEFSADTEFEDFGYDKLYIFDENNENIEGSPFTGSQLSGKNVQITGRSMKIRLVSDEQENYYGFKINYIYPEEGCRVNFVTNGGTEISQKYLVQGEFFNSEEYIPKKEGHHFDGWYTSPLFIEESRFKCDYVSDNMILYAKWTKGYTIQYESNGGLEIEDSVVLPDTTIVLKQNHKEGVMFGGWFIDKELTQPAAEDRKVVADMKLYAKWVSYEDAYYYSEYDDNGIFINDFKEGSKYDTELIFPEQINGKKVVGVFGFSALSKDYPFDKLACYYESVKLPESVKEIKGFNGTWVNNFYLNEGLERICEDSSIINRNNVNIQLPESLKYIGDYTVDVHDVSNDSVENYVEVKIGPNVEHVGIGNFKKKNIQKFTVDADNEYYADIDGILYNKDITSLEAYPWANNILNRRLIIPETVKNIQAACFENYRWEVLAVALPENLETIETSAFSGSRVFLCSKEIISQLPNSFEHYHASSAEYEVLRQSVDGFAHLKKLQRLDRNACGSDSDGNSVNVKEIPQSVRYLDEGAFSGNRFIQKANIPEGIQRIDAYCFSGCRNLVSAYIPGNLKKIRNFTFSGCYNLKEVILEEGVEELHYGSFASAGIKKILIPKSVKYMYSGSIKYDNSPLCDGVFGKDSKDDFTIYGYKNTEADYFANKIEHLNNLGNTIKYDKQRPAFNFVALEDDYNPSSLLQKITVSPYGFSYNTGYIDIGEKLTMTASFTPASAFTTNLKWYSSNPKVAYVDEKGEVTGASPGISDIYVVTPGGFVSEKFRAHVYDSGTLISDENAIETVNSFLNGNTNFNWIMKNDNFFYWKAYLANDSGAQGMFQQTVGQILFQNDGLKNILNNDVSEKRAESILLSYISETSEQVTNSEKAKTIHTVTKNFGSGLTTYLRNSGEYKDLEQSVSQYFQGNNYLEKMIGALGFDGTINVIGGSIDPANASRIQAAIREYVSKATALELFSGFNSLVSGANKISNYIDELIQIETLYNANQIYIEMLEYLSLNCISPAVKTAAANISRRIAQDRGTTITEITALYIKGMGEEFLLDKASSAVFDRMIDKFGLSAVAVKIGTDLGVTVSNVLFHNGNLLDVTDNIRILSLVSVSLVNWVNDAHMNFIMAGSPIQKNQSAEQTLQRAKLLLKTRELGEENYYEAFKVQNNNFISWMRETMGYTGVNNMADWYQRTCYSFRKAHESLGSSYVKNPTNRMTVGMFGLKTAPHLYTENSFKEVFPDSGMQNAVLRSLFGTTFDGDIKNVDWSQVTKETLEKIVYLNGYQCNIHDVTGIEMLKNVTTVNLENNKIESIPDIQKTNPKLTDLNLAHNRFSEIPQWILHSAIEIVSFQNNFLTGQYQDYADFENMDYSGNFIDGCSSINRKLSAVQPSVLGKHKEYNAGDNLTLMDKNGYQYDEEEFIEFVDVSVTSNNKDRAVIKNTKIAFNDPGIYTIEAGIRNSMYKEKFTVLVDTTSISYSEEQFKTAIPDPGMRQAILVQLGFDFNAPDWSIVTDNSLENIQKIEVSDEELAIRDLTGISKLSNIGTLSLKNQQIWNLPEELCNLHKLRLLDISNNGITSVPSVLKDFESSQYVNLSQNLITSVPYDIDNWMVSLNLEKNLLKDKDKFGDQRYLRGNDQIRYGDQFDLKELINVRDTDGNVKKFNGDMNVFKPIVLKGTFSDTLFESGKIKLNDRSEYLISMELNGDKHTNATALLKLDNSEESIPLSRTDFEKIFPDEVFQKMLFVALGTDIKNPDYSIITYNALKNILILDNAEQKYGDIKSLDGVEYLKSLRALNISENTIEYLPDSIIELENLESFSIANTNIQNAEAILGRLTRLIHLDISYCKNIRNLNFLKNISGLATLNISNLEIKELMNVIQEMENLTELNALGNYVENITGISNMDNLKVVNLEGNCLDIVNAGQTMDEINKMIKNGKIVYYLNQKIKQSGKLRIDEDCLVGMNTEMSLSEVKNEAQYLGITQIEFFNMLGNDIGDLSEKAKTGISLKGILNEEEVVFPLVILGDINGDGKIDVMDILAVQNHILSRNILQNEFRKAGDITKDDELTIMDILAIQNDILGRAKIIQ